MLVVGAFVVGLGVGRLFFIPYTRAEGEGAINGLSSGA